MRTLYVSRPALTLSLQHQYPNLNQEVIDHAANEIVAAVIDQESITDVGFLEGSDTVLLSDLEVYPEDADFLPSVSILIVPGPGLFQYRRVSIPKVVEGVPVEGHYRLRGSLAHLSRRDALLYAKGGSSQSSISGAGRASIANQQLDTILSPRPIPQRPVGSVSVSPGQQYWELTDENLPLLLEHLRTATYLSWDTETMHTPGWDDCGRLLPGLRKRYDSICGISVSTKPGTGWYINTGPAGPVISAGLQSVLKVLADPRIPKYGWNLPFDIMMLRHTFGVLVKGELHDGQVAAWLLGAEGMGTGLKIRAWEDLKVRMIEFKEIMVGYEHMGQIPPYRIAPYASADADLPKRLCDQYMPKIVSEELMQCWLVEMRLIYALHEMEWQGVFVNPDKLTQLQIATDERLKREQLILNTMAGCIVNTSAHEKMSFFLYQQKGYQLSDVKARRAKDSLATDKKTLSRLLMDYPKDPLILQILRVSGLRTINTNNIKNLHELVNPVTGRIHPNFNNTAASTGRLSGSSPNLMSIPTRSDLGKEVREVFEGRYDRQLLVADQSQIEPRILAHISGDPGLIRVYRNDEDLYRAIGEVILGIPAKAISPMQRQIMKVVALATQYVANAFTVAQAATQPLEDPPIVVSVKESQGFLDGYFAGFPKVMQYIKDMERFVIEHGYATTLLGRRRRLPSIYSTDPSFRNEAIRQAVNHPIQGSAADIFKLGIIDLYDQGIIPNNIIHDEMVFEGPTEYLEHIAPIVKRLSEQCYQLDVPMKVEPKIGKSWAQAK